jgi:integrase
MRESGLSLFKKNGYYYISYTADNGRRIQKSTKRRYKPDAMVVLANFSAFIGEGKKHKRISFSSFAKDFIKYAESNLSETSVDIYARTFKQFIRIVGDIEITQITAQHWDLFKTQRLNDKLCLRRKYDTPKQTAVALKNQTTVSATTVNVALRHLKASMSTATRWGLIQKNPFERLPLVTVPKKTPAFLTVQDAELLISSITKEWLRDIVVFALNSGMRRNEILFLRWVNVDTEKRVSRISNTDEFTTKSKQERTVAMNDAALMVLNKRKVAATSDYVFTDDIGRRILPCRWSHAFKAAVRASPLSPQLQENLHGHSCRHSFASALVGENNISLQTVSVLLGHSTVKMSEQYSHLVPNQLLTAVNTLDFGMSPSNPLQSEQLNR